MLTFIALVATLNLCLGFALGVYVGEFPGLPRRRPADPPEPSIDLAAKPKPAKKRKAKAKPAPAAEPAEEPAAPSPTPAAAPAAPSAAEVMEGMDAFRAQLTKMSAEMEENVADEDAFGDCATRLQQANHEYLEQAQQAIDDLDEAPDDKAAANCRDVVAETAKSVGETSTEIDNLMADGVPDESGRAEIIAKTSELTQAVESAEKELEQQVEESTVEEPAAEADEPAEEPTEEPVAEAEPEEASADQADEADAAPPAGVESLEAAQEAIETALNNDDQQLVIATLRRDEVELPEGEQDIEARLFQQVSAIANDLLDDAQMVASQSKDQLLMVLKGDDLDEATRRIETIRQQVEKTDFKAGDHKVASTVTCALAQASDGVTTDDLIGQLGEALDESQSAGGNRSYLHDGRFPGPVLNEEELDVKAKTVAI